MNIDCPVCGGTNSNNQEASLTVASCLESSLPGRKPSRLAPIRQWRIGTPCAFLTGP